jgi:HEAT repeats/SIR2-like domain
VSEEVSFLIGAGFSAPLRIPTMGPFYSDFVTEASNRYPTLNTSLKRAIGKAGPEPDLEKLLSVLNAASEVEEGLPGDLLNDNIRNWAAEAETLRSHLLSYIVERCESFDRDKAAELCAPLVRGLGGSSAAIFSTNYDRVIEHACQVAGKEFSDGFKRGLGNETSPWCANFEGDLVLAKLHGSVTWYVDPSKKEGYLRLDRGYALPGPEFHLSRCGRPLTPLMIIPTLEKEVLRDPYSHLAHLFSARLSRTALLVVMGSSLRDEHLVSSIRFYGAEMVVLVIDMNADGVANRLEGNRTIALEASAEEFLRNCTPQLLELVGSAAGYPSSEDLSRSVEEFAGEQRRVLSEIGNLDEEQRRDLTDLRSEDPHIVLPALSRLRGKSTPMLLDATIALLDALDADIRCAAASNIGTVASTAAIGRLRKVTLDDPNELVRIEAGLALNEIGTEEARAALKEYQERLPEDRVDQLL